MMGARNVPINKLSGLALPRNTVAADHQPTVAVVSPARPLCATLLAAPSGILRPSCPVVAILRTTSDVAPSTLSGTFP